MECDPKMKCCGEIRLVDDILQAEDFLRLRMETGFAEIPVEHSRKALQNGLLNGSNRSPMKQMPILGNISELKHMKRCWGRGLKMI